MANKTIYSCDRCGKEFSREKAVLLDSLVARLLLAGQEARG